jgi:hypothetical protein
MLPVSLSCRFNCNSANSLKNFPQNSSVQSFTVTFLGSLCSTFPTGKVSTKCVRKRQKLLYGVWLWNKHLVWKITEKATEITDEFRLSIVLNHVIYFMTWTLANCSRAGSRLGAASCTHGPRYQGVSRYWRLSVHARMGRAAPGDTPTQRGNTNRGSVAST